MPNIFEHNPTRYPKNYQPFTFYLPNCPLPYRESKIQTCKTKVKRPFKPCENCLLVRNPGRKKFKQHVSQTNIPTSNQTDFMDPRLQQERLLPKYAWQNAENSIRKDLKFWFLPVQHLPAQKKLPRSLIHPLWSTHKFYNKNKALSLQPLLHSSLILQLSLVQFFFSLQQLRHNPIELLGIISDFPQIQLVPLSHLILFS